LEKIGKEKFLRKLSNEIRLFHPDFASDEELAFQCPACLRIFVVDSELKTVSGAHIIPKAGGGKRETLLCTRCNNEFGKEQDYWLGEFLRCRDDSYRALTKEKHFEINGVKLNGRIDVEPDGDLSVFVDLGRNPPHTDFRLQAAIRPERRLMGPVFGEDWTDWPEQDVNLTARFPLNTKQKDVFVGLLTSAYLAWFDALGYSWVLQSHLNVVREQILNPEKAVIPRGYIQALTKSAAPVPVLVAASFEGMVLPAVIFQEWLILLPSFEQPDAYSKLQPNLKGSEGHVHELIFPREERRVTTVSRSERALIKPDILTAKLEPSKVTHWVFLENEKYPRTIRPISHEEYERLAKSNENVVCINLDLRNKGQS
jgi:DNA-directed RNA polymerase subunit RPC12/RpoP